jgi:hypothetical protein
MLGGDAQESLEVWTYGHVETSVSPSPPTTGSLINVTVTVTDDLGLVIDDLRIAVSIYDIYNSRLFTVYRNLVDGVTDVQFTPTQWGIYRVDVSSSGSETVHSFDVDMNDHMHTIYCPTSITFFITSPEVEVGDPITIVARLENVNGAPLVGMSLNLSLIGDSSLGPVTLVTDANGDVVWILTFEEQGFYELRGFFFGLGTYLPSNEMMEIHSCYGTSIELFLENTGDLVAGEAPLNISVLLVDSVGTPLEGRTITWDVYHYELGLLESGSLVQLGIEPENVLIPISTGGNITLVFSFGGSDHYHSCNAALELLVMGTSEAVLLGPGQVDRAAAEPLQFQVLDEQGIAISVSSFEFAVELESIPLDGRIYSTGTTINLNLTGIPIGNYSLNFTVLSTQFRLGTDLIKPIRIVSQTTILIADADISGHVGVGHSLDLELADSLGVQLDGLTLWVSLYHPDGREIYGGLETSTPETLQDGLIHVSWLPSSTGNYSLVIRFVGDEWLLPSNFSLTILTRRAVVMQVTYPAETDYSDDPEVSVTLSSGFSEISDAEVLIRVLENEQLIFETRITTGYGGTSEAKISGLLAGEYTLIVEYGGTETFASSNYSGMLKVLPKALFDFQKESDLYIGETGTATVATQVLGVNESWNGTLVVCVLDPEGWVVYKDEWNVTSTAIRSLEFTPSSQGSYTANISLYGIPVSKCISVEMQFSIGYRPMPITLDVATTPVAIAVPIVGLLAIIIRKKFGVDLPAEWTGL